MSEDFRITGSIWRSRPLRPKHIQISETLSFNHLKESREKDRKEDTSWTLFSDAFQQLHHLHRAVTLSAHTYLILPRDGNTACRKFGVEVIVSLVQIDSLDGGELLYVQNILTVHCPGLGKVNDHGKDGGWEKKQKTSPSKQIIYNQGILLAFVAIFDHLRFEQNTEKVELQNLLCD